MTSGEWLDEEIGSEVRSMGRLLHLSASSRLDGACGFKFGKTPFVNAFRLARLTNPVEVFHDDPLIVRLGVSHDLFADAVISVRDKTPLTIRDTFERAFGAFTAVGLERSSRPLVAGFLVADPLRLEV